MRYLTILVVCIGLCSIAFGATVTTGSLIDEMIDVHRLTYFPNPAFKTIQFSSYDRRSTVPGGKGWFSNSDGFGKEPEPNFETVLKVPGKDEPGEYLMCDVEGPGAIVRLWTARISGTIRMYLDGLETPTYDGPAEEFFLYPYDPYLEGTGVTRETLTGTFYQRNASYAPVPFARRCRIVWTGNHRETHFYEIQLRKYGEGSDVATFSPEDVAANADRIRRVASTLANVDENWEYRSKKEAVEISATIEPDDVVDGLKLDGPGALERLVLKVEAPDVDLALRQTVVHILFDGSPWGQVQSPVGDLFGAGPGVNPYSSVPFTVASDGAMTCRYVMPYKESVRILFENHGDQEVSVTGSALPLDYTWADDRSMHFRARWRVDHDLVASNAQRMGVQDLPFLLGRGKGVYVGTAVMLLNPNTIPTSWGNWWGEGDEKIFVDDDVLPSIFGTGSEDYFNYAWSANDIFVFPYCGQPRNDGPANRRFVVNYRWHMLDALPFTHSLSFYMELFSHERTEGFSYGRIGYHYARPGLMDDHIPLTDEDLRHPQLPAAWEPAARFGAGKFEFHACEELADSTAQTRFMEGGLWQGGRVLVWTPENAGNKLKLAVTAKETGDHTLMLACMLCTEAGAFRATVDGDDIEFNGKDSVDLLAPYHVQSRVLGAQLKQLQAGTHDLTLTALKAGQPIGLDFLGLRKN